MKQIYLDYAAATPIDKRVNKLVADLSSKFYGNSSSAHGFGSAARNVLESAHKKIAGILGVKSGEIFFTSSGTESVNLALLGAARANKHKGRHIVTSNIEHLAVLNACKKLEKEGFEVTYLPVGGDGIIQPESVKRAIKKDTILVSIMHANNEIGAIQPIKEIARKLRVIGKPAISPTLDPRLFAREFSSGDMAGFPLIHTDACQTAGYLNIRPHALGVDLLSFNGSKIYGPKGIACLYKKTNVELEPLFYGGSQENGLRPGTENAALAAGLALALEISEKEKKTETKRLGELRDYFIESCLKKISDSKLNGDVKKRLPNNINLSFKNVDGEMLMLALDQKGVAVSTGSACTTSKTDVSHVIKAISGDKKWGNIRISLGRETTAKDLENTLRILGSEVARLRKIA